MVRYLTLSRRQFALHVVSWQTFHSFTSTLLLYVTGVKPVLFLKNTSRFGRIQQWKSIYPKAILDEVQKEPQLIDGRCKSAIDILTKHHPEAALS